MIDSKTMDWCSVSVKFMVFFFPSSFVLFLVASKMPANEPQLFMPSMVLEILNLNVWKTLNINENEPTMQIESLRWLHLCNPFWVACYTFCHWETGSRTDSPNRTIPRHVTAIYVCFIKIQKNNLFLFCFWHVLSHTHNTPQCVNGSTVAGCVWVT